jgi:hypothetical protein
MPLATAGPDAGAAAAVAVEALLPMPWDATEPAPRGYAAAADTLLAAAPLPNSGRFDPVLDVLPLLVPRIVTKSNAVFACGDSMRLKSSPGVGVSASELPMSNW